MAKTSQYEKVPADFYQEPLWVTEGLLRVERPFVGGVFDPCGGDGTIVNACRNAGVEALCGDIRIKYSNINRTNGDDDFRKTIPLNVGFQDCMGELLKSIITNPPYSNKQPEELILLALKHIQDRLCLFVRASFLTGGAGRWGKNGVLKNTPLARIWTFDKRPSCAPAGVELKGSGTTDFVWLVWEKGYRGLPTRGVIYRDGVE